MKMKRNWIYWFMMNGFKMTVIINGTEDEMRAYLPEINPKQNGKYSGATDAEVEAAKKLGLPVYLAPTL
jgi:hypothetical protein